MGGTRFDDSQILLFVPAVQLKFSNATRNCFVLTSCRRFQNLCVSLPICFISDGWIYSTAMRHLCKHNIYLLLYIHRMQGKI